MIKRGKNYQEKAKLVDKSMLYNKLDGLKLIKDMAYTKFDETVEVHIRLGVDSRYAEQQVRGAVILPHGTGKLIRVLVLTKGAQLDQIREAGADFVGGEELVLKIQNENWFDYEVIVASPDMMPILGRLGKILGPKGLMPNPKAGTVTNDIIKAVKEIKAGKIEYRLDKANIIHVVIGKVSFELDKLKENFDVLLNAIIKAKPSASKGQYLKSVVLASTMSPGVKLNVLKLVD